MTSEILNIAVLNLDISHADKEANLKEAERIIRLINDVDIAVLPELFSTGFINDVDATIAIAETIDGPTISNLKRIASETETAICGSYIGKNTYTNQLFNRCFFVTPSGEVTTYDKRHLFILSKEVEMFTPGDSRPPIMEYKGWKISMACCYDLRFPCWMRNLSSDSGLSYDMMLVPANWPEVREYTWHHLLIARAIENQAYYVGANRSGEDSFGRYGELSEIIDYKGISIATTSVIADENFTLGKITQASVSHKKLRIFRKAFPIWQSADC